MKTATLEDALNSGACYAAEQIKTLFGKRKTLTVKQIAALKIPDADKVWALTRPHFLDTKEKAVRFALFCAEQSLPIFEARFSDDKRPRAAVKATQAWLENPSDAAAYAATDAAADAARAAAARAATDAAADAARAAADAARAAARAATDAAAYAAADAARAAADAARAAADAAADAAAYTAARAAADAATDAAAAGNTGLTGYSDKTYEKPKQDSPLLLNTLTVISLRLVVGQVKDQPRKIQGFSNPIPPSLI